jgi:hypothetical protein
MIVCMWHGRGAHGEGGNIGVRILERSESAGG